MPTGDVTTAKTDNVDGSIKEAYKNPKSAGIIHCPFCNGSGSIHTGVCPECHGDGHIKSVSVEETNRLQKEAKKKELEKEIKDLKDDTSFEEVRELSGTDKEKLEDRK